MPNVWNGVHSVARNPELTPLAVVPRWLDTT